MHTHITDQVRVQVHGSWKMSAAEVMKWSAVHNKVLEALRLEEALGTD